MDLFEECMEVLGSSAKIAENIIAENILRKFNVDFPLNGFGRIDWKGILKNNTAHSVKEVFDILSRGGKDTCGKVYVIGSDPTIPIIESSLEKVLKHIDDVEAMSPNTWIYNPDNRWVIELYHDGEVTVGLI